MVKFSLGPLDAEVAKELAHRHGISITTLISKLLREEAVIEIAGWRSELQNGTTEAQGDVIKGTGNVADASMENNDI